VIAYHDVLSMVECMCRRPTKTKKTKTDESSKRSEGYDGIDGENRGEDGQEVDWSTIDTTK